MAETATAARSAGGVSAAFWRRSAARRRAGTPLVKERLWNAAEQTAFRQPPYPPEKAAKAVRTRNAPPLRRKSGKLRKKNCSAAAPDYSGAAALIQYIICRRSSAFDAGKATEAQRSAGAFGMAVDAVACLVCGQHPAAAQRLGGDRQGVAVRHQQVGLLAGGQRALSGLFAVLPGGLARHSPPGPPGEKSVPPGPGSRRRGFPGRWHTRASSNISGWITGASWWKVKGSPAARAEAAG